MMMKKRNAHLKRLLLPANQDGSSRRLVHRWLVINLSAELHCLLYSPCQMDLNGLNRQRGFWKIYEVNLRIKENNKQTNNENEERKTNACVMFNNHFLSFTFSLVCIVPLLLLSNFRTLPSGKIPQNIFFFPFTVVISLLFLINNISHQDFFLSFILFLISIIKKRMRVFFY